MTWAKLDDSFCLHRKPMNLSLAAIGLFALGLSYAANQKSDGLLPEMWVAGWAVRAPEAPQELVDSGMWEREGNGYKIHDYLDYNLSKQELEEIRIGARERKKRSRDVRRDIYVTDAEPLGVGSSKEVAKKFEAWLLHYRQVTGRSMVRGSKPARDAFAGRLREGLSLDDLKLATIGCHSDPFLAEKGFDVPETILRASKVTRYVELGRQASEPKAAADDYDAGTTVAQV